MTARRGGRAINGMSRSFHLWRGRGGFPIRAKGKPPRLRQLRWLREILLMTQPPLLAVVQGGECAGSEISACEWGRTCRFIRYSPNYDTSMICPANPSRERMRDGNLNR